MKKYIEKLPADIISLIDEARAAAGEAGCQAYLVGGFVRDLLLGVRNFDLDIVVEGDGIAFAHVYARRLGAKLVSHHRFGTATVSSGHKFKVDIASARKEFYPRPAHLPVVSPGSLRDDLLRRDFTINAMALRITGEGYGSVIDMFGGLKDLKGGELRILHPVSFIDDPTRILRGIRFEQRYDFVFEKNTLSLLKNAVSGRMLDLVEPQRLRDEIILMMKEADPLKVMRRMSGLTGFGFISPKLRVDGRTYRLIKSMEKWIFWFKEHQSRARALDVWLIYFMGLIGGLKISDVRALCRRFAFGRGEENRIVSFVQSETAALKVVSREDARPSAVYHALEPLSYEVIIALLARAPDPRSSDRIKDFLAASHGIKISVSGKDLGEYGLKPGPHYQRIFRAVLNARLDGKIAGRGEEMRLARRIADGYKRVPEHGARPRKDKGHAPP